MLDNRHVQDQYSISKIIEHICNNNDNGKFMEIGAWDGVELSTTYYLEKMKDWTGLLVEPIRQKFEEMKRNRWCEVYNGLRVDELFYNFLLSVI